MLLLGKLGQRFNLSGLISTFDVVLNTPQLALPHLEAPDMSSIDWTSLKRLGFQGVVLDKDNTLTAPYSNALWPPLAASLHHCNTVFDGRLAILSNSAGISFFLSSESHLTLTTYAFLCAVHACITREAYHTWCPHSPTPFF